jgi:hypothetical protein
MGPIRTNNQMGLLRLGETLSSPTRPKLRTPPDSCPRCENKVLRHYVGSPEVTCICCGWEDTLEPPVGPNGLLWR